MDFPVSNNLGKSSRKRINILRFRTALIIDNLLEGEVCYHGNRRLEYDTDRNGL